MVKRGALILAAIVAVLAVTTTASGTVRGLITGKQIAPHQITSRHLVDHTIQKHDLSPALVNSLRGQTGATGAQGLKGDTGATGATGAQGPKGDTGAGGAQGPKGDKGEPGAGLQIAGSAETLGALPASAAVGETYLVTATKELYTWDGTVWVDAGPVGVPGATGAQGPVGPAGMSGYQVVQGDAVAISGDDWTVTTTVDCPTGKVAVGGGASFGAPTYEIQISASYPTADGHGWTIVVHNYDYAANTLHPYVICVTAP